jgi:glyoxylase-like metal-dependent hydrolase (beta-lactamase superfamily II)
MQPPQMQAPFEAADGVAVLPAWLPVPGMGVLPANAFLIEDREPMLVDAGVGVLAEPFVAALRTLIAPERLRWIWLTHMDPDHTGALGELLSAAPEARLVTTFLGAGKLGLSGVSPERIQVVEAGETLALGARTVTAVRPPYFDAPETIGLADRDNGLLFCADAFGAVAAAPADSLGEAALAQGMAVWARLDTPWLGDLDPARFERALAQVAELSPRTVLSAHLPPARDMTAALLEAARTAQQASRAPRAAAA